LMVHSGARIRGSIDMEVALPEGLLDDTPASSIPYATAEDEAEPVVHDSTEASDEAWH